MRVAIMQPTYLPWSGYFGLMQEVDLFIFLDNVQFSRRSWQQRNQIKSPSGPIWLTVPVQKKGKRDQLISEIEIDSSTVFNTSHQKSIQACYSKTEYFKKYSPDLFDLYKNPGTLLADLNINIISYIKDSLGINTRIMRASELPVSGIKDELLASICSQVGATEYLSPPGSYEYLKDSAAFKRSKIPVIYLKYAHPVYYQMHSEFFPYMSCIDMLFNCSEESAPMISNACSLERVPTL